VSPYLELLYVALQHEHGIVVNAVNPRQAITKFISERNTHPALAEINIQASEEHPNRVYLLRCPEEQKKSLSENTSGSSSPMPSGSETNTLTPSESPRPSEASFELSGDE
jgi:hypothetical protein